ncbi:EAL domain-containing protein [Paraburkholderia aspalathi]
MLHIARTHDVSPAMLEIEVTEDSLVSDIEQATSVLAALKQAGIFTSLDDFGSRYSSLSYLVRLPIDTLKIDKSFVRAPVDSVARPLATALCARIGASMIGCHF